MAGGYSYTTSDTATGDTWTHWVRIQYTGTTTITTSNNTYTDCVWNNWNSTGSAAISLETEYATDYVVYSTEEVWRKWTTEELRANGAQREIDRTFRKINAAELKSERELAEEKAKKLLLDLIGEDQMAIYEETGRVFVKGRKYDYIVKKEGLVERIEKDKIQDLCVHLDNRSKYPPTDNVIAMKLSLENDERRILKLANKQGSRDLPEEMPLAACM